MRLAIAVTAVALAPAACRRQEPTVKPLTPVRVHVVREVSGSTTVRYSANIKPASQVEPAFRLGGYVEAVLEVRGPSGARPVQEGDTVVRGAVLARLRQADYAAKLEQVRSQLAAAQSGLEAARAQLADVKVAAAHAETDLARATRLFASGSLTKPEHDGAQARRESTLAKAEAAGAQVRAAEANLRGAEALVREAELARRDSALVAPIAGVVLRKLAEVGNLAIPGQPAFVLADTTSVKATFGVPDSVLPSLRLGSPLAVTAEAVPGGKFDGRVSRIAPAADARTRVFEVDVSIPNREQRLKVGMIAAVELGRAQPPVLAVPLAAVIRASPESEAHGLWVVRERAGRQFVEKRSVTLGETLRSMVAVTSGVEAGDRVVVAGAALLSAGEEVRVLP
jgi:RND family efflux transporter MFP subunit